MGSVATELRGAKELARLLKQMPEKMRGQVMRQAVRAATKPVIAAAKARIPVNKIEELHKTYKGRAVAPGFAQRSITAVTELGKSKLTAWARIGVKREAFYATQFVELGTSKQAKQPWLGPAFEATQSAQLSAIVAHIRKFIAKQKA
jgi:HK97 gp10 family phage protein